MALVFARAVCQPLRADVRVVSAAAGSLGAVSKNSDALVAYGPQFSALGWSNDRTGSDTLRHAYTLLIGLGMRESSGRHCVGRDRSADYTTADSAEAGLFQTSWGVSRAHPTLEPMFRRYQANQSGCFSDVFAQGVTCSEGDWQNWDTGTGTEWQALTKSCPAFAAEYAAVVLRTSGGDHGEFGPIRTRKTQLVPACEAMLAKVQDYVVHNPLACASLL